MGSSKTPKSAKHDDFWQTLIETTELNDNSFNLKVIMLEAAGSDKDLLYLSNFELFAQEEKRSVIKNINKSETIFMVNQLGKEKNELNEDLRVFEEAYVALKVNKFGLPTDMSALVIKQQILNMKKRYLIINDQKQELRLGIRMESAIMIDRSEIKGTIAKTPERIATPIKKGKNEIVSESKKYNTLLRVYGEEWRDKVYVDDFPIGGPNLYVAVTGFTDPLLPRGLIRIGVPLVAVIQIRVDPLLINIPSSLMRSSKRGLSKIPLLAEQSAQFWDDIQNERIKPVVADLYKNIAFIAFKPPYCKGDGLKGDPENIYDELSFLLYDIQDLSRQHRNYLNNIEIIHITTEMEDSQLLDRYSYFIEKVPIECTTIFHIIDSILNAINYNDKDNLLLRSVSSKSSETSEPKLSNVVGKVFNSLKVLHKQENIKLSTKQDNFYNNFLVLNYGDYSSLITFHLPVEVNIKNITNTMLLNMPLNRLWDNITRPFGENEAKINYHMNVLLNSFDRKDVETSELYRLLHVLGFKKLYNNRSLTNNTETIQLLDFKKCYLKRSGLSEPLHRNNSFRNISCSKSLSNRSIYKISPIVNSDASKKDISSISSVLLFECPDISGLISAAELLSKKTSEHVIDNFEYFEDFDLHCSLQVLHSAFNQFNCVNYKYCKLSDSILILFHNNHDADGIFNKEWKTDLRTPVCMQDFFDFILDDHYDWLQSEEKAYDCMIQDQYKTENLDDLGTISDRSCLDQRILDIEMLIEGSLKHDAVLKNHRMSSESANSSCPTKSQINLPTVSTEMIIPNIIIQGASNRSLCTEKYLVKKFFGYDLGDRKHQIFGRDASFMSLDGTNITSKYFMFFPYNQEFATLHFISGNKNNELYVHRTLGSHTEPTTPSSVRVITKNNVQIYWRKHFYDIFPMSVQSRNRSKQFDSPKSPVGKLNEVTVPIVNIYFSFIISCPNGLHVESIHVDKSMAISHIKQSILKHSKTCIDTDNEEKRCITKNGEVVIFKMSGNIEVLFHDSSYILCTKYKNIFVQNESNLKQISSGTRILSDKKKHTKDINTQETKDRSKKENLKSRENESDPILFEMESEEEKKYKLLFLEYIVIEADGKKKQFIDNHFEEMEVLLIRTATDYSLGEVFSRRIDGTHTLYSNDGMLTVTFANGTRIISSFFIEENDVFPEWTKEECTAFDILTTTGSTSIESINQSSNICKSRDTVNILREEDFFKKVLKEEGFLSIQSTHIIEHKNYATVTVDISNHEFTIDMPNSVSVTINDQSHYKMKLDDETKANFDSHNFHIDYDPCSNCNPITSCDINMLDVTYDENNFLKPTWFWLKDSYGKRVSIDYEGILKLHKEESPEHELPKQDATKFELPKREDSNISEELSQHCNCKQSHFFKSLRFIVLHRDMTVSELVHKQLVKDYKRSCLLQPWSSVSSYDAFGDNRKLLSILRPIDRNESEIWLMNSKFTCKPQDLVFKDLRADEGKGFYKWMRPYGRFQPEPRKPPPVVAPALPRALVLRTLEHLWKDDDPESMKGGRELFNAIIKYLKIMDEDKETMTRDPVRDLRSKNEVDRYQRVQELAQRTIEKMALKMDTFKKEHKEESNPVQIIKNPLLSNFAPLRGEDITEATSQNSLRTLESEVALQELEKIVPMSPQLARYWKVRAEENKQEQFFKEVLRQGTVPPYFENIFGGEIWWDMNNSAGDAVAASEDAKRPRCCCQSEPEVSCESWAQQDVSQHDHETSGANGESQETAK